MEKIHNVGQNGGNLKNKHLTLEALVKLRIQAGQNGVLYTFYLTLCASILA